jgi:hypothetical protein
VVCRYLGEEDDDEGEEAKRPINKTWRWINCTREHYSICKHVKRVDIENAPNSNGTSACSVNWKLYGTLS